ncbi:DUF4365 domain-containing protein [Paraburkholderia sediminicola]|uniref:DUF4365 domain-containing protein n=1 Tax=Paraburkholderia sediminicola TaxID=458836 RepID=UPI0038B7D75C
MDDSTNSNDPDDSNPENLLFPQRPENHITETEARKILENRLSRNWIVRPVPPPDYGLDFELEWTAHNKVTGLRAVVQSKGTESIPWTLEESFSYSKIKPSTTNYWLENDVPVFIVLSDLSDGRAYFSPAKTYIRANYQKVLENKSIPYRFYPYREVGENGGDDFMSSFLKERRITERDAALRELPRFHQSFMNLHFGFYRRDGHMPVADPERERELLDLARDCERFCSLFEWHFLFRPERAFFEAWKSKGSYPAEMLERDFSEWLDRIDDGLAGALAAAKRLVGATEKAYWAARHADVAERILRLSGTTAKTLSREARLSPRGSTLF